MLLAKMKMIWIFLLAGILSIGLVNAFTISQNTILNTSLSNSSMNFSVSVTADNLIITQNALYFENITYTSDVQRKCTEYNHSKVNNLLDSVNLNCSIFEGAVTAQGVGSTGGGTTGNITKILPMIYNIANISITLNDKWVVDTKQEIIIKIYNDSNDLSDVNNISFLISPIQQEIFFNSSGVARFDNGKYHLSVYVIKLLNNSIIKNYNFTVTATGDRQIIKTKSFSLIELQGFEKFKYNLENNFKSLTFSIGSFLILNWILISLFLFIFVFTMLIIIGIVINKSRLK